MKKFHVQPGYMAQIGHCWHDHTVVFIEEDESVAVFTARDDKPRACIGEYQFTQLDPLPAGLRPADYGQNP